MTQFEMTQFEKDQILKMVKDMLESSACAVTLTRDGSYPTGGGFGSIEDMPGYPLGISLMMNTCDTTKTPSHDG